MANWKNIRKLRDHLKAQKNTKYKKFAMRHYIKFTHGVCAGERVSIARIKKNGAACGTACCLAGEAFLLSSSNHRLPLIAGTLIDGSLAVCDSDYTLNIPESARKYLRLTDSEARFMFYGGWTPKTVFETSRVRAVKYLTHVLEQHNIFVDWHGTRWYRD